MSPSPTYSQAAVRVVLAGASLVIAAWLALSLSNERLQVAGIKLMAADPPQPAAALKKFQAASRMSASQQPELFEASAYFAQGDDARAITMLQGLLAEEPDNRTGWLLLANWLRPGDPRGADAAFARARVLDGKP
ncbi:MAG: tetratricopeptide repeat protein [Solirubrobacterales bacterium]